MKQLLMLGIVLGCLVACDSNDDSNTKSIRSDSAQVESLKEDNTNLTKKLATCEELRENLAQQLQAAATAPQGAASSQSQPQETAESEEAAQPTTTEVDGFELIKYGDTVVKVKCQKAETAACGVSFTDCEDNNAYDCLRDVKYKSVKMTITE